MRPNPMNAISNLFASAVSESFLQVFSTFFTNSLLSSLDPTVMSRAGLGAILLWGLAYASVSRCYRSVPYLVLVFCLEKLYYTAAWLIWLSKKGDTLPALFSESPLTAMFYSMYGAGDFAFALFFLWVAVNTLRNPEIARTAG